MVSNKISSMRALLLNIDSTYVCGLYGLSTQKAIFRCDQRSDKDKQNPTHLCERFNEK